MLLHKSRCRVLVGELRRHGLSATKLLENQFLLLLLLQVLSDAILVLILVARHVHLLLLADQRLDLAAEQGLLLLGGAGDARRQDPLGLLRQVLLVVDVACVRLLLRA